MRRSGIGARAAGAESNITTFFAKRVIVARIALHLEPPLRASVPGIASFWPIVRRHHEDRILILPDGFDIIDQTAKLCIHRFQGPGVDGHTLGRKLLFFRAKVIPARDGFRLRGEWSAFTNKPKLLRTLPALLAGHIPAGCVSLDIFLRILARRLNRDMHC